MMKKAVSSEMILTAGLLIAVGITMLQIRRVFLSEEMLAQSEVVASFASDLENIVKKSMAVTGDANFVYRPTLKKYTLEIKDRKVEIQDMTSGKSSFFLVYGIKTVPNRFENSRTIYVIKKNGLLLISNGECKKEGSGCLYSIECCDSAGYCWGDTESFFECKSMCADAGKYANDRNSCCSGFLDVENRKCEIPPIITTPTAPSNIQISWPIDDHEKYGVTSCFGWRTLNIDNLNIDKFHAGIDLGTPEGTDVRAAEAGKVVGIRNRDASFPILSGYGNYVMIEHVAPDSTRYYTLYAHLRCSGVLVALDDIVSKGQIIGKSGGNDNCRGFSTGEHLHFQVMKGGNKEENSFNPCLYLEECPCPTKCESYEQKEDVNKCPRS